MSGTLAPSPWFTGLDDDGEPLAAGLLEVYLAGTSTPATVYQDSGLTTPHENPIVLDGAGRATIFLEELSYKFILKRWNGTHVRTQDNVTSVRVEPGFGFGEVFIFGGDYDFNIDNEDAYPVGAGLGTIHKGTTVLDVDSAVLPGSYVLEAMIKGEGGIGFDQVKVAMFNMTDAPDTPIAEMSSSSSSGILKSAAITFAAPGAVKRYAIKTQATSLGDPRRVWMVKIKRVAP